MCVDFSLSHSGIEEMNAGVYYISNKAFVFGMQNKLKTRIGFWYSVPIWNWLSVGRINVPAVRVIKLYISKLKDLP